MYPISLVLEFIIHGFLMRLTHSFSSNFQLQPIQTQYTSPYQDLVFTFFYHVQPINTTASRQRYIIKQGTIRVYFGGARSYRKSLLTTVYFGTK